VKVAHVPGGERGGGEKKKSGSFPTTTPNCSQQRCLEKKERERENEKKEIMKERKRERKREGPMCGRSSVAGTKWREGFREGRET
jgi:hypothetical protein